MSYCRMSPRAEAALVCVHCHELKTVHFCSGECGRSYVQCGCAGGDHTCLERTGLCRPCTVGAILRRGRSRHDAREHDLAG